MKWMIGWPCSSCCCCHVVVVFRFGFSSIPFFFCFCLAYGSYARCSFGGLGIDRSLSKAGPEMGSMGEGDVDEGYPYE